MNNMIKFCHLTSDIEHEIQYTPSLFQKLMTYESHSFTITHPFIILKKEAGHIHAYCTRYPFPYRVYTTINYTLIKKLTTSPVAQ